MLNHITTLAFSRLLFYTKELPIQYIQILILYMKKLLLFTLIFLISYCSNKPKDKVYLPDMKFKRTKNPNYSHYFPSAVDTVNQNSLEYKSPNKTNATSPISSFNSQPISNSPDNKENTPGFFASLFGDSGSKNNNSDEEICSELMNINKTVITEQIRKLTSLKDEKKKLLDEINNLNSKYQWEQKQNQRDNQRLEKEVNRLNRLIKILSSELK